MGVRKAISGVLAILLLFLVSGTTLAAHKGYTLDERAKRIPAPYGYVIDSVFDATATEAHGFRGPLDMHIGHDGKIYVADTGNNRVLVFDENENLLLTLGGEGADIQMLSPEGIYTTPDGNIYVCDTGNARILKFDAKGKLLGTYNTPKSSVLPKNFRFNPSKMVVDERGYMYVVDANPGLILLDFDGQFRGFFAPNRIGFDIRRLLVKTFATKAQKERLAKETPPAHTNVSLDDRGFIYSVTAYAQTSQIKKLNSVGVNTYEEQFYGERDPFIWPPVYPTFVDIAVDEYGVISVLDSGSGNIYQYDQEGNMLLVFGGKGEQRGQFTYPTSIAAGKNGTLYVLDSEKSMIQVFKPTEFANLVHQASKLYYDGRYEDAGRLWQRIQIMNRSFALANRGMGKSYFKAEQYDNAMVQFHAAKDRENYSRAYGEMRHAYARGHFGVVVFGFVAAIFVLWLVVQGAKWVMSKKETDGGWLFQTLRIMLKILITPTEAFEEIKRNGVTQQVILLMALAYIMRLVNLGVTSYHFTTVDPEDTSLLVELVRMVLPWFTWCIANYAITTISEGEAFFKDVCLGSAYALSPYILFSLPISLLSRIQTLDDSATYVGLRQLTTYWCVWLFFSQVRILNDYQVKKAIQVSIVSLVGVGVIWGMSTLIYGLTDQLIKFIQEVVLELTIRG